jgi:hypothetical protein
VQGGVKKVSTCVPNNYGPLLQPYFCETFGDSNQMRDANRTGYQKVETSCQKGNIPISETTNETDEEEKGQWVRTMGEYGHVTI